MSKENIDKELQKEVNEDVVSEKENMQNAEADDSKAEEVSKEETMTEDAAGESEEQTDTQDEKNTADDKKSKKKIFGKKDKKDQQIEELTDKHQRLMAEFQNFRNRSEKEKTAMFEVGAKSVIEKILPIVDNFERGIKALSEEDLESPVGQGMTMIYKQLTTTLNEMGVEVIEAEGCEFNPELHNAVMHVEDEELGENVIAEEFQKGYTYRGAVIRYSMVKVAN